jgi:hypothetical protein
MKFHKFGIVAMFALFLMCVAPAFGQSDRGTVTGTVKDPSGAVVINATVTATNLASGEVRTATSGDEGSYTLPELKADVYRLTAEAAGFRPRRLRMLKSPCKFRGAQISRSKSVPSVNRNRNFRLGVGASNR